MVSGRPICIIACGASAALFAAGCEDRPRPWSGRDGPAAVLSPPPAGEPGEVLSPGAETAEPDAAPEPSSDAGAAPVDPAPAEEPQGPSVKPGGLWSRCHEGWTPSGDPLRDVTRLTLLCGPSNGMRRKARQAIVGLIGEGEPPVTAELRAVKGACYRVFAVASPEVGDLEVTVRSSRGIAVAADHARGRLAVVQPDRPFCTFDSDVFTVEIAARRGAGRFAAEVWSLGEPRKKGESLEMPADEPPLDNP